MNLGIFAHASVPHSKFQAEFFLKICSPQRQREVEKTEICFIKIQSEDMKVNEVIYIFYDL